MKITPDVVTFISALASIVALVVSSIALLYTAKAYLLKSGIAMRGTYTLCSSIACDDDYISGVTLENLKDRAVVIFNIYIRLGHNYFVEIDNFENEPLIVKPFEVIKREYDPVDLYTVGTKRIVLQDMFGIRVKKQLVLATSEGQYNVKSRLQTWSPVYDFFTNYMTAIVAPMRTTFKGKSYGGNARYIVEFKFGSDNEDVVPIYPHDYHVKKFRTFRLTEESLTSRDKLLEFLYDRVSDGTLTCTDVEVYDAETWRNLRYEMQNRTTVTATYDSWFAYHVMGRIVTKINNYRMRRNNRRLRRERAKNDGATQ